MDEKITLPAGEALNAATSELEALVDGAKEAPVATLVAPPVAQPRITKVVAPIQSATPPPEPQVKSAPNPPKPPAPSKIKFVKLGTPADPIVFKDGTRFSFPLIERNGGAGFSTNSEVVLPITNEVLIANLREVAARIPGYGIKEIK